MILNNVSAVSEAGQSFWIIMTALVHWLTHDSCFVAGSGQLQIVCPSVMPTIRVAMKKKHQVKQAFITTI